MKFMVLSAFMILGFLSALTVAMLLAMAIAGLHSLFNGRLKRFGIRTWCVFIWAAIGLGIYFVSGWLESKTGVGGRSFLIGGFVFPGLFLLLSIPKTTSDFIRDDALS